MSLQHGQQSPIVQFLGDDAGAGGPFALLGLKHEIDSDDQIYLACTRRLAQVDRNRHRSTPDADEVRLAIHTAASQLLDQAMRNELQHRWPPGTPASLPKAWKSEGKGNRLSAGIVQSAKMIVAASGGWNSTARKRLVYFAQVKRIHAFDLISSLRPQQIKHQSSYLRSKTAQPETTSCNVPLVESPPSGSLVWMGMYVILFVLGASVGITILFTSQQISLNITNQDNVESSFVDSSSSKNEFIEHSAEKNRTEFEHYTAIAHELDQLVVQLQSDYQSSVDRFRTLYPLFVQSWTAFPSPALDRSGFHIVEFVRRGLLAKPDDTSLTDILVSNLQSTLNESPDQIMIQSAIISVLHSDAEIGSDHLSILAAEHVSRVGFEPAPSKTISRAIIPVVGLIGVAARTDDSVWWTSWIQGLDAGVSEDKNQRDRFVLSVLTSRVQDQIPASENWEISARLLVNKLAWREGSSERFWLFRQFADQRASTNRLAPITEAIAVHSSAPQVSAQMVLNSTATTKQREQVASLYREAWESGPAQSDTRVLSNKLANDMHVQVSLTPTWSDQDRMIKNIILLAQLNAAAWATQQENSEFSVDDFAIPVSITDSFTPNQQLILGSNARDDQWAFDAINAQDIQSLSRLFAQLVEDGGPGVNSAYALVYLTTLNSNSEMRSAAASQIIRYRDHPSVLIALDHAIAGKRVTSRLGQLVSSVIPYPLPDRTSEHYFIHTHAYLIELLVASLARDVDSPLPALESELIASYVVRLDISAKRDTNEMNAVDIVKAVYLQQMMRLNPFISEHSINQRVQVVMNRVAVLLARSVNPLQSFLAYQRGICELLVIEIGAKHPTDTRQLQDSLEELAVRLSQSKNVLDQIAQAERCMSQLWIIQLEAEAP